MNHVTKKSLTLMFILCVLCSRQMIWAVITIKTTSGPVFLQIAWAETVERSVLLGTKDDGPRLTSQTPVFENSNAEVRADKPYMLYPHTNHTVYLSLAPRGASRSKQITLPVLDGVILFVTQLNENEITIDRPIDLISNYKAPILVKLIRHEPRYGFVRKNHSLQENSEKNQTQENEELFNYQPIEGEREIETQIICLAPSEIPFKNGCLSQEEQGKLMYRLYKARHRFMVNSHLQMMRFVRAKGLLTVKNQEQPDNEYTDHLPLSDLLPLRGEQDVIEFSETPQDNGENESFDTIPQTPEATEWSHIRCGIITKRYAACQSPIPPYINRHCGAQSPDLVLNNQDFLKS